MQNSLAEKLKQPVRWLRSWFWVLYNGYPTKRLIVIGVTGTDGKTTTCWIIYEILKAAGYNVGMITTVGIKYCVNSKFQEPNFKEIKIQNGLHVTNPDAKVVQGLLKKMADEGVKYVILEVTSHRLAQMKTVGYNTQIAVMTNISREHLDYHGTMVNYVVAKVKLFEQAKYAILNKDDKYFEYFKSKSNGEIYEYGKTGAKKISISLAGEYNLYNIGAAEAVGEVVGIRHEVIENVVKTFVGVPGRREEVNNKLGIRMIVDFAHTPNALEQLLTSLREESKGKIILVFGCTGERDKGKRPEMGLVAQGNADEVIITADDPRSESLDVIYGQIIAKTTKKFLREDDRDKAIGIAVKMAKKGDIVVATGMGHEGTILIKGQEIKRSDRAAFEKVDLV